MFTARPRVAFLLVGLLGALGAACAASAASDETDSAGAGVSARDGGAGEDAGSAGAKCGPRIATKCGAGLACDADAGVCEKAAPLPGDVGATCGTETGLHCNRGLDCSSRQAGRPGVCFAKTEGDEGDACGGDAIPVACSPYFVCKKASADDARGICTAPADGEEGGACGGGISCLPGLSLTCKDESGGLGLGTCVKE